MNIKNIQLPFDEKTIKSLKAGDYLELNGVIYTARDQAHLRLYSALKAGQKSPVTAKNPVLYYCGPTPEKKGEIIGSAGPTTSGRMDKFTPYLISKGFRISIGKGSRSPEVRESIKKYHGLYLTAFGGCGALYHSFITKKQLIAYPELLSEAIYKLEVANFPVTVAIDSQGRVMQNLGTS